MITREELEKETEMTFFRGSGPGGQNRNKVETGVRLRHVPTGITVAVEKQSSQAQNREIAFKRLAGKIEEARKPEVPRGVTRVPRREKKKRLKEKKKRSQTKELRREPAEE